MSNLTCFGMEHDWNYGIKECWSPLFVHAFCLLVLKVHTHRTRFGTSALKESHHQNVTRKLIRCKNFSSSIQGKKREKIRTSRWIRKKTFGYFRQNLKISRNRITINNCIVSEFPVAILRFQIFPRPSRQQYVYSVYQKKVKC